MNYDLISKIEAIGFDRFHAYIKSIASGDGSVASRMSSGPGGAVGPFDRLSPKLKTLGKQIAAELPTNWDDEAITQAVKKELGLQ